MLLCSTYCTYVSPSPGTEGPGGRKDDSFLSVSQMCLGLSGTVLILVLIVLYLEGTPVLGKPGHLFTLLDPNVRVNYSLLTLTLIGVLTWSPEPVGKR